MRDPSAPGTAIIEEAQEPLEMISAEARTKILDRLLQRSWSELGRNTFEKVWSSVLIEGAWLEDRVSEALTPRPGGLSVKEQNELYFYVFENVQQQVAREGAEIVDIARRGMLRHASHVTIRVTRDRIEIKDLHCHPHHA